MNLHRSLSNFSFSHIALLVAAGLTCGCGQQASTTQTVSSHGIPEDWSTHHVRFSDPGYEADAIRKGTHAQWLSIVNNPRYQMQQLRRNHSERFRKGPHTFSQSRNPMHRDWSAPFAPQGGGIAANQFPAKYSFDINAAPTCSDFVVYASINVSATQANIIGFNNLYDGACPSSAPAGQPFAPNVKFAYEVGNGSVQTSPVLSLDGTKVAFVEDIGSSPPTFHVLTLGTTGNNGSAYNTPVPPCTVNGLTSCTTNNAVDTGIVMSGTATDYNSAPFVDYANDIAYVGDDAGTLHKFTGVFRGTPAEVTTGGWPFAVPSGANFTGPVYDSVSQHIFVGSLYSNPGSLFCVDLSSGAPALCGTSSVPIAPVTTSYQEITDAPMVDSTSQMVFATGYYLNGNYVNSLLQTDTSLANPVQVSLGNSNYNLKNGDFDNAYYSGNYASGYLYACGGGTGSSYGLPTLYRIGFDISGKMNASTDGNSYQLGTSFDASCTPLTEVYNSSQSTDYLFLGINGWGTPASCTAEACIMSFVLPSAGGAFPIATSAGFPYGPNGGALSGIIVDNVSNEAGASQIYVSNGYPGGTTSVATQLSQSGLN